MILYIQHILTLIFTRVNNWKYLSLIKDPWRSLSFLTNKGCQIKKIQELQVSLLVPFLMISALQGLDDRFLPQESRQFNHEVVYSSLGATSPANLCQCRRCIIGFLMISSNIPILFGIIYLHNPWRHHPLLLITE